MKTPLGDQIHALLKRHVGEDNCITSAEIAEQLGLLNGAQRRIREIIATESALWQDIIVCGFGGLGYFVCQDLEEAVRYRDWLLGTFTEIGEKVEAFEAHCARHGLAMLPPLDDALRERVSKRRSWLSRLWRKAA